MLGTVGAGPTLRSALATVVAALLLTAISAAPASASALSRGDRHTLQRYAADAWHSFDVLVDAHGIEDVACDRVQECPIEVAVRKRGDLELEAPLDVDPQLTVVERGAELLAQRFDRVAHMQIVELDALNGIRARGVPVPREKMLRSPARDTREFGVIAFEALAQPVRQLRRAQ